MILAGQASRWCDSCRTMERRTPVVVLVEHRRWWTERYGELMFFDSVKGEVMILDEAWVTEVAGLIWG